MIEKILDSYFTIKLKRIIKNYSCIWFIDKRFIKTKDLITFQIKRQEYNDEQFRGIISFYKEEAILFIIHKQKLYEDLYKLINEYCDKHI